MCLSSPIQIKLQEWAWTHREPTVWLPYIAGGGCNQVKLPCNLSKQKEDGVWISRPSQPSVVGKDSDVLTWYGQEGKVAMSQRSFCIVSTQTKDLGETQQETQPGDLRALAEATGRAQPGHSLISRAYQNQEPQKSPNQHLQSGSPTDQKTGPQAAMRNSSLLFWPCKEDAVTEKKKIIIKKPHYLLQISLHDKLFKSK